MVKLKALAKFPLVVLFFLFISLFSLLDTWMPDKEASELENRKLQQQPAFDLAAFLNNEWTLEYGEYVKDQLWGRDNWITLQSMLEGAQGKLENNGVWFASDGYQIAKNDVFTGAMQRQTETNRDAVGELAARFPGQVSVMVVPSPANVLSERLRWRPPQANENAILNGLYGSLAEAGARVIDLRPVYEAHDEETLFYRTDHHWTTRGGAWLAYEAFCRERNIAPSAPAGPLVSVTDFYGTNYAKTKRWNTVADTLEYYDLPNTLTVYTWAADGSLQADPGALMDTGKLNEYDKYGAFLRGNNGYSVIEGNGTGSILVIKDSYGNCFAPYLIENYASIGVIDLRNWVTPVDELIVMEGYEEILVLYCFESFATDNNLYRLQTAAQ